ncbi:MAG TPA: septal ring lytic transglycosylase RlpA family protein [Spirochaetota bacterium]|nr:septal ring lytic transglycosylase RlpA family protein [Spirochaetota bacterium]
MMMTRRVAFVLGIAAAISIGACAPNKALTRDSIFGRETPQRQSGDEYVYKYDNVDDAAYEPARSAKGPTVKPADRTGKEFGIREEEGADSGLKKEKFFQTGMASWYGREFHGRMTASGERFDMKALTAAHRTLPFGTTVTVRNLDNGEIVKVRINDRGPYRKNRILDLSYAAAKQLNMLPEGEAKVGIVVLGKDGASRVAARMDDEVEPVSGKEYDAGLEDDYSDSRSPGADGESGKFALQAGAFYSRRKAENLKELLSSQVKRSVVVVHEDDFYKVRIEGIPSRKEAENHKRRLMKDDISAYVIEARE